MLENDRSVEYKTKTIMREKIDMLFGGDEGIEKIIPPRGAETS